MGINTPPIERAKAGSRFTTPWPGQVLPAGCAAARPEQSRKGAARTPDFLMEPEAPYEMEASIAARSSPAAPW